MSADPRRRPVELYILSLDVGQQPAPSALSIIKRTGQPPALYGVTFLRRWDLGSRYQQVVNEVKEIWDNPVLAMGRRELVVDKTGVGRPIVEMFEDRGLEPWAITITGGFEVTQISKRAEYHVPRRVLLSTIQVVMQGMRLRIAEGLPDGPQLQQELLGLRLKIGDQGEEFVADAPGGRDDLAMSTAQGIWLGEYVLGEYDPEAERRAKQEADNDDGPRLPLRL